MKQWMQHKAVRIAAWVLLIFLCLCLITLICVQGYISVHKKELLAKVHEQLNGRLRGKITIEDMDVNAWRHFPRIEVALKGVSLVDSVYHKPLLTAGNISTRIGIFDVTGGRTIIRLLKLTNGRFHLFTDTTGYSNKYLLGLKPRPVTDTGARKKLEIREVVLQNMDVLIEDAVKGKRFGALFNSMDAKVNVKDTLVLLDVREDIQVKGLGFNLEKGSYLTDKRMEGRWRISFNTASGQLSFPATRVKFNKQPILIEGNFFLTDSNPRFRLGISAEKLKYADGAALLTSRLQQKLLLVNLDKPLDVAVSVSGGLKGGSRPLINVSWKVKDNRLITPVAALDSCSFTGFYTNEVVKGLPLTDENSRIVVKEFAGKWGAAVFKGSTSTLTNLANPELAFDLYSDCSFPALNDQFGLRSMKFMEGRAKIELHYKGPPLVKNAAFLHNVKGSLEVQNGAVYYEARDLLFTECNGKLAFAADSLELNQLTCKLGENKFTVNIDGKEIGSLGDDGPHAATISCSVYTPSLNLADFRHLFKAGKKKVAKKEKSAAKTTHAMLRFDEALEQGSLQLHIRADAIKLNRFTASGLNGDLIFRQDNWQLQKVSVQHAGGSMFLKGDVRHLDNNERHDASIYMTMHDMDVRKVFYAFDNFGQKSITYNHLRGKLNSTANLRLGLNDKGDIVPNSMNGSVWFSLRNGALINHEPVQKIQQFVFKDRDMKNISFAVIEDSLIIKNNEIEIRRMEIHSSVMTLFVEGIYSLADKTDISIQVPLHNFLSREDEKNPRNKGVEARNGPSIYLRAKSDVKGNIKLGLDLFKKFRKRKKDKEKE